MHILKVDFLSNWAPLISSTIMLFVNFSDPKFIYDSVRVQFLQVMSIIINNL